MSFICLWNLALWSRADCRYNERRRWRCSQCEANNPASADFCGQCGAGRPN